MSVTVQDSGLGTEVSGAGFRVVDVRGQRLRPTATPVLVDPSGRRARRLTRAGRGVAFLCLVWILGLGLAGLGLSPANHLPLGLAIGAGTSGKSRLPHRSAPSPATPAEHPVMVGDTAVEVTHVGRPRVAVQRTATGSQRQTGGAQPARGSGRSGSLGSSRPTRAGSPPPAAATAGSPPPVAAGPVRATGGRSPRATASHGAGTATAASGRHGHPAQGNSGSAPGHTQTVTAAVLSGQSASAAGHTGTPGGRHDSHT